jgi:hypothetical protein
MSEYHPTTPSETASLPSPATGPVAKQPLRRLLWSKRRGWIVAAAVMSPVIGLSAGLATSPSASASQIVANGHSTGGASGQG